MKLFSRFILFLAAAIHLAVSLHPSLAAPRMISEQTPFRGEPVMLASDLRAWEILDSVTVEKGKTLNTLNVSSLKGFFEILRLGLPVVSPIQTYSRHNTHFYYPIVCYKYSPSHYTAEG
ncbi:MAG: hypothetical protein HUU32_04020 [Calditrichaceae bacterium]|nr:hypothetical protein [Calditrichia bacterium]NUQ40544.1 hypothetical protein [Calditrichaceae bacterium]